ncbi:GFA family protein [Microbulbifer sp. OS29]|uniref:GFA family protein n=1 Tax=Microbulbifer okhotskensis TaxID=2926617 RepID=A0A9X2J5W1_9GAMM|nr:GFA family protein [Microbulbifer okhotskensis]MCO1335608.1 GFA family protein [Microbulbifer okhotskensis]
MHDFHKGGCVCGQARFRTLGSPRRVSLCSCHWCRKRTGSVLGLSVYFDWELVIFTRGQLKTHRLNSDAGRWIKSQFCPECGSALSWTLEFLPRYRGLAGGAFDHPEFIYPERYVFSRSKPEWLEVANDISLCPNMAGPAKDVRDQS